MFSSHKRSRRAIRQSLVALATIALLPTTTGAMANTLAESMGLTTCSRLLRRRPNRLRGKRAVAV